jgi:hypothetical protein
LSALPADPADIRGARLPPRALIAFPGVSLSISAILASASTLDRVDREE